jgi:deoxyribose-phosphate aldolase
MPPTGESTQRMEAASTDTPMTQDPLQLARDASRLGRAELASLIDHTLVRAHATQQDIIKLCEEASRYRFATVCVNPAWAMYAAKRLAGSPVGVCVCVGFPLGAATAQNKATEAREAIRHGATEVDMVINIGAIKSGFPDFVRREVAAVVRAAEGVPVKVILETGYLTREEKVAVCELSESAGAAFVKTATGFGPTGAALEDVVLMRKTVGTALGVKAAGGIRTYADAVAMLEAGASRLGSSSGPQIIEEMPR